MPKHFIITIPCKPYVRQYMEQNFGSPCDITSDKELLALLKHLLDSPNKRYSRREYNTKIETHKKRIITSQFEVMLKTDIFYRHGYFLSLSDTVEFCKRIESRIKDIMRSYVMTSMSFGIPTTQAIINFQNQFNFPEDTWSFETIKKDIQRKGIPGKKKEIRSSILQNINEFTLVNLSRNWTNVQNKKNDYEKATI